MDQAGAKAGGIQKWQTLLQETFQNNQESLASENEYNTRWLKELYFNPFTAPACKIAGLNVARTRLQTVDFPIL